MSKITSFIILISIVVGIAWIFSDKIYQFISRFPLLFAKRNHQHEMLCPYRGLFLKIREHINPSLWPFLYYSELTEKPYDYVLFFLKFFIIAYAILSFLFHPLWMIGVAAMLAFVATALLLFDVFSKNKKEFEESLLIAITLMKNAIHSGQSLKQSFELIVRESQGPVKRIFQEIVFKMNLGVGLEKTLDFAKKNIQNPEFSLLCSALSINVKTGGHMTNMLERLEYILTNRRQMQKKILIAISASKTDGWIVMGVTLSLLLFVMYTQDKALQFFLYDETGFFLLKVLGGLFLLNLISVFSAIQWIKSQ